MPGIIVEPPMALSTKSPQLKLAQALFSASPMNLRVCKKAKKKIKEQIASSKARFPLFSY
jgi:hypothetical protein